MMIYNLVSSLQDPIKLHSSAPAGFPGLIIQGSETAFSEGDYGYLLMQEVQFDQFAIGFNAYRFRQHMPLQFASHREVLHVHVLLKSNLRYFIQDVGNAALREGQFNILHSPSVTATAYFEKNVDYRTFNTYYYPELFAQLYPLFPQLQDFIGQTRQAPALLLENHGWTTVQIVDVIMNLLHCPYTDTLRRFYFDNKIKELLFLLLIQKYTIAAEQNRLTRNDRDAIHEAKSIIEKNTGQHITSRKIAQEVGMNEFKLKNFFKQVFGIGMFEFMVQVRMQKARILLLETDKPIKEIATLTGYTSIQNFQTAFRKYFNCTPASLRKQ